MNEIEDLQKSVEDSLARGFYILACNPKDKSPMARYSPHAVNSATNDPETACRPYADGVPANYGVACGQSNLTVADFDHGFKTLEDYEAWRQEWNIPETFTVVSGRDKGDLGIHAYYSGETTSTTFERGDVKGDLKSKGGYVVGPGRSILQERNTMSTKTFLSSLCREFSNSFLKRSIRFCPHQFLEALAWLSKKVLTGRPS